MVNSYIAIKINLWSHLQGDDFALGNSLFGAVNLTKNSDPDKYSYFGYGKGFNARGSFSLSAGSGFGKNVTIFGSDMSLSLHIDNKKKDISSLGKDTTNDSDDTTMTAEKEYFIIKFAE